MLFNSWLFVVFFIIVIVLYRFMNHQHQNRLLLIASYVFYGTWDWRFLSLIIISTLIDYTVGKRIGKHSDAKRRKVLLAISVVANLGMLAFFKYFGFFTTQMATLLEALGFEAHFPSLRIILPVGISFYTFQTMSYTIDIYRKQTKPIHDILDFALYVSFFPQLVAGPIERSTHLMPQVLLPRKLTATDFNEGLYLVCLGFFKKVVIADNMAIIANAIFNEDSSTINGAASLVAVYAFAFQIYGDFSGYSAIARGISKWLGFDLMVNFRMPYFAISPKDFWSRWHISLSTWLRDYLYIPLGGNRGGEWKIYRNLMLTMLLGGLWHGAGWNFIVWGAFHGVILVIYRLLSHLFNVDNSSIRSVWINAFSGLIMFHLVCVTWLLFRAKTLEQAWLMFLSIFGNFQLTPIVLGSFWIILFYVSPLMIYEYWVEKRGNLLEIMNVRWSIRFLVYSYFTLMILFFHPSVNAEFIYFQF